MSATDCRVTPVEIPSESRIAGFYEGPNLADAYAVKLPVGAVANPELIARFVFANPAPWIRWLMGVRDALVASFGLKTSLHLKALDEKSRAGRVGIFRVYSRTEREIVLGEDDKHLDFRLSVLCSLPAGGTGERDLVVSTVVHCHNRLGRTYIFLIAPFHRLVVQASLRRAARIGWPRQSAS